MPIGLAGVYPHADYVTVNISSPNTKNLPRPTGRAPLFQRDTCRPPPASPRRRAASVDPPRPPSRGWRRWPDRAG
ncbi:hypothetical protein L550_0555 [Bordetella pertussis H973]|nr:hypothetical protein L550_0555 [Bordetella pertussis H973]